MKRVNDNRGIFCCGKKMSHIKHCQTMMSGISSNEMWLCKECGCYVAHETGQLDEEEKENYIESYLEAKNEKT